MIQYKPCKVDTHIHQPKSHHFSLSGMHIRTGTQEKISTRTPLTNSELYLTIPWHAVSSWLASTTRSTIWIKEYTSFNKANWSKHNEFFQNLTNNARAVLQHINGRRPLGKEAGWGLTFPASDSPLSSLCLELTRAEPAHLHFTASYWDVHCLGQSDGTS